MAVRLYTFARTEEMRDLKMTKMLKFWMKTKAGEVRKENILVSDTHLSNKVESFILSKLGVFVMISENIAFVLAKDPIAKALSRVAVGLRGVILL
ncbi:hypothetical protein V6N13_108031 [Hibiscus sabdariffa]